MREWTESVWERLESAFLHGRIGLREYDQLADAAQLLILQVEDHQFGWGTIEAEERFAECLQTMGVTA